MSSSGTSESTPRGDWGLAAELASMTNVWRRLLEDHVPNARGRCQACTQGGTGIAIVRWPCGPRQVAEAAARYHAGQPHSA